MEPSPSAKPSPPEALVFDIPADVGPNVQPRCKSCGYVLFGLTKPRCPECARPFNPLKRASYDLKPPLMFWRYWLPGVLTAFVIGSLWALCGFALSGSDGVLGWSIFVGIPMAMGAFLGYGFRAGVGWSVIGIFAAMILLGIGIPFVLFGFNFTGDFCGACCAMFSLPIIAVGYVLGWTVRAVLKDSAFSQRWHLPIFAGLLLMPGAMMLAEELIDTQPAIETVSTTRIIAGSQGDVFDSLMFYEQVPTEPPLLLKLGLPRVVKVMGSPDKVGQLTVCVYTKGRLVKRTTQVIPGERLAFDVIEQHNIESRSIRLIDGSFAFKAVTPETTEVTLTTTYQPLLRPRWMWRAIEHEAVHDLHEHVMNGMAAQARIVAARQPQHATAVLQP